MPQTWSTPEELVAQVERLWERGELLRAQLSGASLFPRSLRIRRPTAREVGARFNDVRRWIRDLEEGSRAHGYSLELEEVAHRQLGRNQLPSRVWVRSEAEALRMIGKGRAAERFHQLRAEILAAFPALESWVGVRPLRVLETEDEWPLILSVLGWFQLHPCSGLYRRQLEIEGVDTKFIERHRLLLTELLELSLPAERVVREPGATFDRKFGLLEKPARVRFRLLDESQFILGLSDLSVPAAELARLELPVDDVIVTENEVNGLALPARARTLVVFGQGYALERLGEIPWLASRRVHYWGDIDTHGFAMLDRFRAHFGRAESLLMDRETMLSHRKMWVVEDEPSTESLTRLTDGEHQLVRELQRGTHGERVRLEQERISFAWVRRALEALR
jgi:hypothetical protein